MNGPPPDELVHDLNRVARAETAALVGELRAGGDAAWSAPAHCSGWAAKDTVAHLVRACELQLGFLRAGVEGRAPAPFDPAQMQAIETELAAQPRDELLARLERSQAAFASYTDGLDVNALQRPVQMPFGTIHAWQVPMILLDELVVHHWDIRAPQNPDARLTPEAVPALVLFIGASMPMLALGEKQDGTWQLDVDAPTGGPITLRVQNGQVSVQPGPAPAPDVRLALDGDAFVRLIWGRLDLPAAIASGRVRVQGDRERALALQRLYPGV
jgi:uncharacterized protein (TIGR03083 family)